MVDRLAESGAIKYAQESTADVGTIPRLAGAGQIEADMIRLAVEGVYTEKVSALTVRGRLINKMIDAGFLPKKRFNFTDESKTLDSSITFSRTSNATVTDSDGLIKFSPHNLLSNSESFDAASWVKTHTGSTSPVVTANAGVAPNNTTTADKIDFGEIDAAGDFSIVTSSGIGGGPGNRTLSVYLKAVAAGDVGKTITLYMVDTGTGSGTSGSRAFHTLTADWQRVTVTQGVALGTGVVVAFGAVGSNFGGGNQAACSAYVWGAQLTQLPCVSNDYISTTPANLLGFTEEYENAAWTKSNSFVQTNLLTYSEQFDNAAWTKENVSVTANSTASPNGTTTADTITASAGAGLHRVLGSAITAVAQSYTISVFAKKNTANWLLIRENFDNVTVNSSFDLNAGVVGTVGAGRTASIQSVGDGWYRCIVIVTAVAGSRTATFCVATADNTQSYTAVGTESIYIWGAQLVQGSDAGEYTQTGAAAAAVTYTDPFGVKYAKKLVENTANDTHIFFQTTSITTTGPSVFSLYVKAAERTWINLRHTGSSAFFNLSDGTIGSVDAGITASVNFIGNGWYRCVILKSTAASGAFGLRIATANNTDSYTGDGTSGIYISGAQLSNSASLDPYVYNPTTAITSAARYLPRFNYSSTGEAQGLLIEEQRTNSIRNNTMVGAVAGSPGTLPTNWSVSAAANLTTNVVGTGVSNGVSYIDLQIVGTSNSTSYILAFDTTTQIAATTGQSWTESFWMAITAGSLSNISAVLADFRENNSGGTQLAAGTVTLTNPTSTLNRLSATRTLTEATTAFLQPRLRLTITNGAAIDITLRIGMPQLELGAFATSVIPTSTTAVTRNADNASILGRNFASWYNQNEGTVYGEASSYANLTASNGGIFSIDDNTNANRIQIRRNNDVANPAASYLVSNASSVVVAIGLGSWPLNTSGKLVATYKTDDFASSFNGSPVLTDTSGAVPISVNRANIGFGGGIQYLNGTIKSINYWPTRLTNAQLQAITA